MTRATMRSFVCLAVVSGLLGCGGESFSPPPDELPLGAPVRATTDRTSYRPGDDNVGLTFRNYSDTGYGFNPCDHSVERQTVEGWEPLGEPTRFGTKEQWVLMGGRTSTATTDLPDLDPGTYRLVYPFTLGNSRTIELQVSNSFSVQP
jgi:hypothetical protein